MGIKYYRFAIFICLFLAFTFLQDTFCLCAEDAHLSDIYLNNLSNNEPLKQLFHIAEKINEPIFRFEALVEISLAFQEIKESALAESSLLQASNIAHNTKESTLKNIFISTLIDNYIKLGQTDKALEIAKYMDFPDSRNDALLKIVMGYIQQGQYGKAISLSESIDDLFSKTILFYRLINWFTEQKAYSQILKVQDMIKSSSPATQRLFRRILAEEHYRKSETPVFNLFTAKPKTQIIKEMVDMAKQRISLKDNAQANYILERAIVLSKDIKSDYFRDDSLTQIGLTFVEMGELKKAQEIAKSIKIAVCRSELLAGIAIAYTKAGASEQAIILAEDIGVVYQKNNVLIQTIMHQLNAGKEKEASQLMDSISNTPSGANVYYAVADYYIKNRKYENIVKICEKINGQFIKFKILVNMAKEIQKTKDTQPAGQRAFKKIIDSFN